MLSRDWSCLNKVCREVFHSYEHGNPECPKCGCVRTAWLPGGGHIAAKSPGIDRTVRGLAEQYGMTNVNTPSPSRLNRAMPKHWFPVEESMGTKVFGPGFAAEIDAYGRPTCSVSGTAVRGSQPINKVFQRTGNIPGPEANRTIVGRWSPP